MAAMLPDGRRLGAHLAMGDGLVKSAERAVEIGATALQVFSDNPTAWQRRAEPSPEIPRFREVLADHDIAPLAIHGSYLINLAGVDERFREGSIELLTAELGSARAFGARYVNIHAGSHRGAGVDAGIERIVDGVERALEGAGVGGLPQTAVVLENSSGGGGGLGIDVEQLEAIASAADRRGLPRHLVGFCLDIAHLWGAGVDVARAAVVDALVRSFADSIGIDRLRLIHLNDTKAELGSRMDRHEHLGAGRIGPAGLAAFLTHPALTSVTYILETPGMDEGYDAINLERCRMLIAGESLPKLPPEAFRLSRRTAASGPAAEDVERVPHATAGRLGRRGR